ncbi:unnamed protein product [Microthlaspi erraticum]|uniref:Uncharacterized protein n=1 Tax=Microthlaspi erraticum TaxID=1685480 RepID=A0A6D2J5A5_9BRAS|nr:unnamed protein product [Microthlaspi erraticum]
MKKLEEEGRRQMSRRATNSDFTSSSHIKPPQSNNNKTSLRNNNLSVSQSGFGLGQSTYDLSPSESILSSSGFSKGLSTLTEEERRNIFEISQEFQTPTFGQYGTTSDVLGTNSNLSPDILGSNYAGIIASANGDLTGLDGIRVNCYGSRGGLVHDSNFNGYGNSSLGGLVHDTSNVNGYSNDSGLVHDTSNANGNGNGYGSLGGLVHDTSNVNGYGNGFLDRRRVHGTDNENGNGLTDGIREYGFSNGNVNDSLDGTRVHGIDNGNGSLGQSLGGNNWNFNSNTSYHGSSTSRFPSALSSFLDDWDQSHNNFIDDVIYAQENPSILNDHHGANGIVCDTTNSQFDQNKGGCMENPFNVDAANSQTYFSSHDMNITNQGYSNIANSEMYFPPQNMSITDQGDDDEDLWNLIDAINDPKMYFPPLNISNQGNDDEEPLIPTNPDMYFPPQDGNGAAELTEPPLSFHHDSNAEDAMDDYLLDHEMI